MMSKNFKITISNYNNNLNLFSNKNKLYLYKNKFKTTAKIIIINKK